jgi:hypothetical protein
MQLQQRQRILEEQTAAYETIRSYEALRNVALTYIDQVLRYKFAAGDNSAGLRSYLEANYGIPNNREQMDGRINTERNYFL